MSKRIYLSGNTINCYENFTLVCTKDFDNIYFTDNYSLVDDEEYFDAEFESLEALEDSYESKIKELNDKIADLEAKLAESESELEKQKEKYDKLYGCYKKTSSEDLQDKYRLAEENEQLKKQLQEIKNVKSQELAEYLDTSIPKFIVNEKVKLLERVKEEFDSCYSGDTYSPYQIADKIDEIIAELTHQHEDKGE